MPLLVDDSGRNSERLNHAFGLLASAELGHWPECNGPDDGRELRARVELLALLSDTVPRGEIGRLDAVVAAWGRRFPDRRVVSSAELRAAAREALQYPNDSLAESAGAEENLRRVLAISGLASAGLDAAAILHPAVSGFTPDEAERQCVLGLYLWFQKLANDPGWNQLPAVIANEPPTDIDKVYVELFAIADQDAEAARSVELERPKGLVRRMLAGEYPVVSVPTMVARTMHRCVVVGEPGGGKSTLVRWLAWATYRKRCPDFDVPVVVKLSAFASALATQKAASLLDYFFASLATETRDWRPAADQLRRLAGKSHRFLLLLDGWDEVPVPQREAVRECILAEAPYFVTLITSRPAGLPRQLCEGERVDFYHIAGLAPRAAEELVRNNLTALGRPDLFESIRDRIQGDPDLREMAANPFLLSLLVRVLKRTSGQGNAPHTLADVYRQVLEWVQEQHDQGLGRADPLTTGHTAALRRLSYQLLFERESSRYLFRGQELAESLSGQSPEPVRRSRFINRVDPDIDEYGFLHATFQEYFAARHTATFSPEAFDAFADSAFASASRLIVLEFVAGLGERVSARCRERAREWFRDRDRFQQVLLRVGRLASAGRWPADDEAGLGRALRDELWREIQQNRDMALTQVAVAVFAELDPVDLARRARAAEGLDNWAVQCIVDSVPKSVGRREQLDELLTGEWRDYAGFDARGGATDADLAMIRADLVLPGLSRDDRRTAAIHAGAVRDAEAVPGLLPMLAPDYEYPDLQQQAIDSLGRIGSRAAIDALVDVVVGEREVPAESVTQAIAVLRHSGANCKALDPLGRDRLVRRLAALPADDPVIVSLLAALEGYPLRDGAMLIHQLAGRAEGPEAVRTQAVRVLATVTDRQLVQDLLLTIGSEPVGEVADALLHLAIARRLYVPLDWLKQKLVAARDKRKRREWLTAYLLVQPLTSGSQRDQASGFLHRLVEKAFHEDSEFARELVEAFPSALFRAERPGVRFFPEDTLRLARDVLANYTDAPEAVGGPHVLFAVSIIDHFRNPATRSDLRNALDAALRLKEQAGHDPAPISQALANALARVAPAELLGYPADCAPVESALRALAVQRGWMVFADRITNAEGVVMGKRETGPPPVVVRSQPAEFKTLIEQLPEQSRKVLQSYWIMLKPQGPCSPHDAQAEIYAAMQAQLDEGEGDLATYLDNLFPEGLPKFDSWRRTLKRVESRFAGQPELLAILRRIGLCRRRRPE